VTGVQTCALPIFIGGALLNGYKAAQSATASVDWLPLFIGMICAAVTGYIAIRFMLALITKKRLWGFAIYVAILGAFVLLDQTLFHLISW
jgi:undecaprenyl-diphosphatase